MGEIISDCSVPDLVTPQLSHRRALAWGYNGDARGLWAYMARLRVLRGDTPRLKPELEEGSSAFEVDVAGLS